MTKTLREVDKALDVWAYVFSESIALDPKSWEIPEEHLFKDTTQRRGGFRIPAMRNKRPIEMQCKLVADFGQDRPWALHGHCTGLEVHFQQVFAGWRDKKSQKRLQQGRTAYIPKISYKGERTLDNPLFPLSSAIYVKVDRLMYENKRGTARTHYEKLVLDAFLDNVQRGAKMETVAPSATPRSFEVAIPYDTLPTNMQRNLPTYSGELIFGIEVPLVTKTPKRISDSNVHSPEFFKPRPRVILESLHMIATKGYLR